MGTMNQLEAKLWPYKLALIKAFGLDPEQTSSSISVEPGESITFTCLGHAQDITALLRADATLSGVLSGDRTRSIAVEFMESRWNEAQRQAVHDYLGQFRAPRFMLGDVEAMREALAATGGTGAMVAPVDTGLKISRADTDPEEQS